MAEQNLTIRNTSASSLLIDDLGLVVDATETINLGEYMEYSVICDSDDLKSNIASGTIVINDGSNDLTPTNGINYVTRDNVKDVRDKHYTKTEMQTSGSSAMHWDNITNAPSFGSAVQLDPVEAKVTAVAATAPASPAVNDIYTDTGSGEYKKWNGTAQVVTKAVTSGDRIIRLDIGSEPIQAASDTTTWALTDDPIPDNAAVLVDDDGDGGQAQYAYSDTDTAWKKIGDVDFGPHLDGGANKHNDSEINVQSALVNIGTTSNTALSLVLAAIDSTVHLMDLRISTNETDIGTLQTNVSAMQGQITSLLADSTAQQTEIDAIETAVGLNQDGSWTAPTGTTQLGSSSSVKNALVILDTEVHTNSVDIGNLQADTTALQDALSDLQNEVNTVENGAGLATNGTYIADSTAHYINTATSLADADSKLDSEIWDTNARIDQIESDMTSASLDHLKVENGVVFGLDDTRSKQLGDRETINFGRSGRVRNTYLRTVGDINSNQTGVRLEQDMVLVGITGQLESAGTCVFHVRKNNQSTDEATLSLNSQTGAGDNTKNVDFSAGDVIELYCSSSSWSISNAVVRLIFAINGGANIE